MTYKCTMAYTFSGLVDEAVQRAKEQAALTVVHNPRTMERQVSTHGVAYYGSNWYAERECYTAEQMRAYAMQERAAERERCYKVIRKGIE